MQIIGRRELINLPEFKLLNLEAKIDTGAYSCAIHCHHINEFEEEGIKYLEFELLDPSHPEYSGKKIKTNNYSIKKVRSSNGKIQKRYKIICRLQMGIRNFKTEFTLTNRKKMRFAILIGRKSIKNKFLVDVSKKYILQNTGNL